MKTLFKQSLIVALLCFTLTSYASDVDAFVRVDQSANKIFTLSLNYLNHEQVQIFIKDKNGVTLYTEGLNITSGHIKRYDLKALPLGDYILGIENQQAIKLMPFKVKKFDISFLKMEETKIFKPYVRQRGKMFDVMFRGSEKNSTQVIIYDENGRVLKKNKTAAGEHIERIYDFSLLPKGTYYINFLCGNREFSEEITL